MSNDAVKQYLTGDFKYGICIGEIQVLYDNGTVKYHCFNDDGGLRHGELRLYHPNGDIARKDLYVRGVLKNDLINTKEDMMHAALKYGVPFIT